MQLTELRGYVARWGWQVSKEYVDRGFSGSRRDRPGLKALLQDADLKHFDVVVVWKLDRFARSVKQLHEYVAIFSTVCECG
jgi:site-specific DNA recombinase